MKSFKSFDELQTHLYFSKNTDINREIIYGKAYVLKLAEIRSMNKRELGAYLYKYGNWYRRMKQSNVHSWTKNQFALVSLFDYVLNKKRLNS
jgi:hypothetical protein